MALNITAPFKRGGAFPIDESLVMSKAEMLATNDNVMPEKYLCVCKDDGQLYLYDKEATPSAETGKYKVFEGGGSSDDVFFVESSGSGKTAYADLLAAIQQNKFLWYRPSGSTPWALITKATVSGNSITLLYLPSKDKATTITCSLDEQGTTTWASKVEYLFQARLTSGENIKTINNESLLGAGNIDVTESMELTQAEYDALSDDEKNNGTIYFITDRQGGGGGGEYQWIVLSKDLVISANELRAIENSKKPIMWFDGYYYTPITHLDVNSEWGYGYLTYTFKDSSYTISFSYDGDDWTQPVTWDNPYAYQMAAKLSLVNQNGGVKVSQNISGIDASMWLCPEWNIPNFVNSRLMLSSTTKTHDLMTRYSQPQNIVKTGEIEVSVHQVGAMDSKTVDISDLNFASKDEYRVITTYEQVEGGVVDVMCGIGMRTPSSFTIEAHNMSDSAIFGNALVNYMVLANKYYEHYASSTNIINSTVSGDKYTWTQIVTDKSAYSDFSVLKNGANNVRLRVYVPNATTPALAQYDIEGTEIQDAEHWYYPIKWANPDGTRTPFDNFVYLARSRRGGNDDDLWLASAPNTDGLDTYQCPAIDRVTIVREK